MKEFIRLAKVEKYNPGGCLLDTNVEKGMICLLAEGEARARFSVGEEQYSNIVIEKGRFFGGLELIRGNEKQLRVAATASSTVVKVSLADLNRYRIEHGGTLFNEVLQKVVQFNQYLEQFRRTEVSGETEKPASDKVSDVQFLQDSPYKAVTGPEDEADFLMAKNYTCPLCGEVTESMAVRITKIKQTGQGDFFMNYFEPIDPLWYGLVTCGGCGYTAREEIYETLVKSGVEQKIASIKERTGGHKIGYSQPRTLEEVLNGCLMYMVSEEVLGKGDRGRARVELRMFELLCRSGFEEEGNLYRDKAFEVYKGMFATGILDVDDQQLQQLYLILGKLHEHRGELKEAKGAYRNAKMLRGLTDTKFAELAESYLIDLQ